MKLNLLKLSVVVITSCFLNPLATAGFNNLTIHSRANCANNESISWDATRYHVLLTVSDHLLHGRMLHHLAAGWENTWRSANVHWGEAAPGSGWHVQAGHYINAGHGSQLLGYTTVDDCSIYDGWWDKSIKSYSIETSESEFDTTGLPVSGSGVTIVPKNKMNLPQSIRGEQELHSQQQKNRGYSDSESSYPKTLLNIGNNREGINSNSDIYDTHLKYQTSQIKLAFQFKEIPEIDPKNIVGFAAGGMYLKDKGWTGISEIYNEKGVGTCKYNLNNMKLEKGAVQLSKEEVRYDINKKPSDIYVEGSINSGFTYTVSWFDDIYRHTLECVNMNYEKNIINRMIEQAKKIDKNT